MTTLPLAETMTEAIDAIADRLSLSDYLTLRTLAERADEDSYAMAGVRAILDECGLAHDGIWPQDGKSCDCLHEIELELGL